MPMMANGQWMQVSSGIGNNRIVGSMASGNGWVYAGILIPMGDPALDGVYRSSDNGLTWEAPEPESSFEPMGLYATGSTVYGASYSGGFIFVSYDSGATFDTNDQGNTWSVGSVVPCGGNIISHFAYGIFQSIDADPYDFVPNPFENTTIRDMASNGVTMAAIFNSTTSQQGRVMTSTDCGSTWQEVLLSSDGLFNSISMSGSTVLALNWSGVHISTDLGGDWNSIAQINGASIASAVVFEGRVFATTNDEVYVSLDNGQTWIDISDGSIPPMDFNAITIHDGYVFMGTTSQSVWRRSLTDITSISEGRNDLFMLYPVPAHDRVELQVNDQEDFEGGYTIYTLTGQKAAEGRIQVSSAHACVDVSALPEGMYILALDRTHGISRRHRFIKAD